MVWIYLSVIPTDRHRANLFYDPETDCFCAIDMDNIFRRDLPAIAYEKLHLMLNNKKQFTKQEIKALIIMRDESHVSARKLISILNRIINEFHK